MNEYSELVNIIAKRITSGRTYDPTKNADISHSVADLEELIRTALREYYESDVESDSV